MHRRTYLESTGSGLVALGTLAGVSGCIAGGGPDDGTDTASDGDDSTELDGDPTTLDLRYPEFQAAFYYVEATPASSDASAVTFEELSHESRVEVANGVARERYLTASPAVLEDDAHTGPVEYRGQRFDVSVMVADRFQEPEYGPESGPDWSDPAAIEITAADGELQVELENVLDDPLPVHHAGRPYFGVLTAVGETAVVLEHDAYDTSEHVQEADGILRTDRIPDTARTAETLDPGEALTDRYGIPSDWPEDARIWITARIGDESIDRLGNRSVTATGTYVLE